MNVFMNFSEEKAKNIKKSVEDYVVMEKNAIAIVLSYRNEEKGTDFFPLATKFNKYYSMHNKPRIWYDKFYGMIERLTQKQEVRSIGYMVRQFRAQVSTDKTIVDKCNKGNLKDQIHISYCSKLYALVYLNKPIWDDFILRTLGFIINEPKVRKYKRTDLHTKEIKDGINKKIIYYEKMYDALCEEYEKHLEDDSVKEAIKIFDDCFPNAIKLSSVRKIEFIILSCKSEERTFSAFDYYKIQN